MPNTKVESQRFGLENRRYIGCKAKLTDWIFSLIGEHTRDVHRFCDIFSGTGVVANRALSRYEEVVVNDFLYSNNVMYRAFFADEEWDEKKLNDIINSFNVLDSSTLEDNYFSENFGGKYFDCNTAKIIGHVRDWIEDNKSDFTNKEYTVLLASLIYSIDKLANTLGHFEAYIKKEIKPRQFKMSLIDAKRFPGVEIHQEDANKLARDIHVDLVYLDPPYNSRQYSRFYHVYETLVKWDKQELYGDACKPKEENMSDYCRVAAFKTFTDLVAHIDARYIVVSYNNTYNSKSSSSKNKITLEQIEDVLSKCGRTEVFSHDYTPFNSGKTEFDNHKEYLFITEVDNEKRNCSFAPVLRG